jgi:hypothetical protein
MSSSPKLDITEINNDANPEIVTGLNSTVNLPVNPPVNVTILNPGVPTQSYGNVLNDQTTGQGRRRYNRYLA